MTTHEIEQLEPAAIAREVLGAYERDGINGIAMVYPSWIDSAFGQLKLSREVARVGELLATTDGYITELKHEIESMKRSHDRRVRELETKIEELDQAAWDRSEGR